MAIAQDLNKLANEYVAKVVEDQRELCYRSKVPKEARDKALKHTASALKDLATGARARGTAAN